MSFSHLKPGDRVTRMLAGTIPMEVEVGGITENGLIECFPPGIRWDSGWTFDPVTGVEIDEDIPAIVGAVSFLVREDEGHA